MKRPGELNRTLQCLAIPPPDAECKRISYGRALSPGPHSTSSVVASAQAVLAETILDGEMCYVGATWNPHKRMCCHKDFTPHFPKWRSMTVLAYGSTDDICACESAVLASLNSSPSMANSKSSKGGEHIPRDKDRNIYLYMTRSDYPSDEYCPCPHCRNWEDRTGRKRTPTSPLLLPITAVAPFVPAAECRDPGTQHRSPQLSWMRAQVRQRQPTRSRSPPSQLVVNMSYPPQKDRVTGDVMGCGQFRKLMGKFLIPYDVSEINEAFQQYLDVCCKMHCVVGRGYFENRLQMFMRADYPAEYQYILDRARAEHQRMVENRPVRAMLQLTEKDVEAMIQ